MTYQSWFTNNAKADIKELKGYVVQNWSKQVWKTASDQIKHAVSILEDQPYAGAVCQDLAALGITDYRQMLTSKNRIIYEVNVANNRIIIHISCDQKRDVQTLLLRRLINLSLH
jgi:toxin ParE1/3/4